MNASKTKESHLAKTQFYRWYQLYEREINEKRIDNQLDILLDHISLKSAAGEMKGKANYPERLAAYKGWQNAHHVKHIEVETVDQHHLQLEADIHYQNIQPDGQKKSYSIHYSTKLEQGETLLPKFSHINIAPTGETNEEFEDAYPTNRLKSLMHYWLVIMENLDGNIDPFKELLASDFKLNFSSTSQINSLEELAVWFNGIPMQLQESNHHPEKFSVKKILDNEYEMTVEFDWNGITRDGKKMIARTKHVWYVVDDINNRFAKILRIDVSSLIPFQVLE